MKSFKFELASDHSPEDLWTAINTPIKPGKLNDVMNHGMEINYSGLNEDGLIMTGSRIVSIISSIKSKKLIIATGMIGKGNIPDQIAITADIDPTEMTRIDTFEEGQVAEGFLKRRVEGTNDNNGLIILEGQLAINGLDGLWPTFVLGDINETAIHYMVKRPNEDIVTNLPEILAQ